MQVGVHEGFVLSPLLLCKRLKVITEYARGGFMNEILFEDDVILTNKSKEHLKRKFLK